MARIILFLATTTLVAIVVGTAGAGTREVSRSSADPIVLGMVLSKTGFMSAYDGPPSQGVDLAVRDINTKGGILGRKIKVIRFDQKTDAILAGTGATKLIGEGATAIIAACDFDFGAQAAVVANSKKIPAISTCAGDPKFGVQGIGPYAYQMALGSNYQAGALAEWAYQAKKWRNAYLVTDTTVEYTKGLAKYITQRYTELGGKIVGKANISIKDTSIAAQITQLKSANPKPQVIFVASFVPDLTSAIKQIRAAGITTPIVGGSGYDGEDWLKAIPNLSNVYFGAEGYTFGPGIPRQWALTKAYKAAYGKWPTSNTFLTGYAVVEAFAAAIEQAGTTNGVAVNNKLTNFKNVPTALGSLSYTPTNHSPQRPMALNAFKNGQEVFLGFLTPKKWPNAFGK